MLSSPRNTTIISISTALQRASKELKEVWGDALSVSFPCLLKSVEQCVFLGTKHAPPSQKAEGLFSTSHVHCLGAQIANSPCPGPLWRPSNQILVRIWIGICAFPIFSRKSPLLSTGKSKWQGQATDRMPHPSILLVAFSRGRHVAPSPSLQRRAGFPQRIVHGNKSQHGIGTGEDVVGVSPKGNRAG